MECEFLVSDLYFNPNVCHTCKSSDKLVKKCTGCHMISYCSKEHQKLHWPSHKSLCLCLKNLQKNLGLDYYSKFRLSNKLAIENESQVEGRGETKCEVTVKDSQDVLKRTHEPASEDYVSSGFFNNLSIKEETSSGKYSDKIIRSGETPSTTKTSVTTNTSQGLSDKIHNHDENITTHSNKDWIQYKFKLLHHVECLLGRKLRNIEKEIVLKPKCCFVCKQSSVNLMTCESCLSVNYCDEHKLAETHVLYCKQYSLLYKINKYIVNKYLTNSFAYIERISNFLDPYKCDNDMEYYELSEYTSFYRTLVFLIKLLKISNRSLTIHVVGASEYECSPYSVYLWENIFHHLIFINTIAIKFVGFDVTSDQFDLRLCENCVESGRKLSVECHQMSYDSYIDEQRGNDSSEQLNINADLIIAFNAGFQVCLSFL
uniref:Rho GTPase-activating protein gacZ n=1 Tax=Cacopsylla melanoneura TaxID=428564 RepID=A0A8D9AXE9_9HEMI